MQTITNMSLKNFVLFSLLILLAAVPAVAADQIPSSKEQRVLTVAQQRLQVKITYSCRELSIDTVLMQLAEQAQIDIIKSPKVTGKVTVKVTNVPLEEALSQILAAHGYTYIASESMVRVEPVSEVTEIREKLVTRIYRITYADVCQVSDSLQKFISKRGEIAINKGTSNLMVTDVESKIRAIDNFIEEIDRETPQILVEARIYDITSNEFFVVEKTFLAMRNTPVTAIDHTKESTREDISTNISEETVLGSGGGTETNTTYGVTNTGFINTDTETTTKTDSTILKGKPWFGGASTPFGGSAIGFSILNDAVAIEFFLAMLQAEAEVELLANPRILVLDNETAKIKIVREIPYTDLQQTSQGGSMTTVKFKEVGVKLDVTPHITRDGMVRLHIVPEFGIQSASTGVLTRLDTPEVNTRKIETTTLVKDGQTVVLGGLRRKDSREINSKVPLFGDLPLLGSLFRSTSTTEETVELVIFITTRIVTRPELTEQEKIQLEATEFASPEPMKTKTQRDKEDKESSRVGS